MIVHPLCQRAHPSTSKDVCTGICQHAVHSTSRSKAKIVTCVGRELVIGLQVDDEAGPLVWSDWDRPVCLHNIMDGGLGAWGETGDE